MIKGIYESMKKETKNPIDKKDFIYRVWDYGASGEKTLSGLKENQKDAIRQAWATFKDDDDEETTDDKFGDFYTSFAKPSRSGGNRGTKKPVDKKKYIIHSNQGYVDFEGKPSDNIPDSEYYMEFGSEDEAKDWVAKQKKKYDNTWSDSLKPQDGAWRYE